MVRKKEREGTKHQRRSRQHTGFCVVASAVCVVCCLRIALVLCSPLYEPNIRPSGYLLGGEGCATPTEPVFPNVPAGDTNICRPDLFSVSVTVTCVYIFSVCLLALGEGGGKWSPLPPVGLGMGWVFCRWACA